MHPSIRPSVCWLVCDVFEKVTFRVSRCNKTYLCTFLQDNSESIDSIDSSDSSDSCDSSDSNDSSDSSDQTTLYTKKLNLPKPYLPTYLCDSSYCRDSSDSSDSSDRVSMLHICPTSRCIFVGSTF